MKKWFGLANWLYRRPDNKIVTDLLKNSEIFKEASIKTHEYVQQKQLNWIQKLDRWAGIEGDIKQIEAGKPQQPKNKLRK
mmetsp:Transcript_25468/g.29157  ORF Transcript_25468/g.29157 Transcript_25468/m.29157 type:complete len:80 (+) Transcript_25468:41-280(+)